MSAIHYALIADGIAIFHGIVSAFIVSSLLFTVILRRELPNWYYALLIIAIVISGSFLIAGKDCPLTSVERYFRYAAGQEIYQGSFHMHYFQKLTGLSPSWNTTWCIDFIMGITFGAIFFNFITKKLQKNRI